MSVIIAPGRPEDYPALAELWEASVRATHHFVAEADIHYFQPLVRDVYLGAVTLTCAFDGHRDGRALGFSGVVEGKIEMLFVAPPAFGRGIGTQLLRHAWGPSARAKWTSTSRMPEPWNSICAEDSSLSDARKWMGPGGLIRCCICGLPENGDIMTGQGDYGLSN